MQTETGPYAGRVSLPPGEMGGVELRRITVAPSSLENLRQAINGRSTRPGEYTGLYIDGLLWMSDTDAEWHDHWPIVRWFRYPATKRVLINGLGLGMVVQAALDSEYIEHIDVVEIDQRVIDLIGPHYSDPRVHIHQGDAYTITWPPGTRWDAVWHDIWRDLCTDNLALMARLHRRYGRRSDWQGSWGRPLLESARRRGW